MIPIVKSVIAPSSQLFKSISDFFFSGCFYYSSVSHLLYIIYHMVYHMSSVLYITRRSFSNTLKAPRLLPRCLAGRIVLKCMWVFYPIGAAGFYAFGYILIIQRINRIIRTIFTLSPDFLNTCLESSILDNPHCAACQSASQSPSRSSPACRTSETRILSVHP